MTIGQFFDVPIYTIDVPFETPNEETISYVAKQFAEFVRWAEKEVPGVRFDEKKLVELHQADCKYMEYLHDIYEIKKRIPCPLLARDAFREESLPSYYPDPKKVLGWAKEVRDELYERAEKGIGLPAVEKLRVAWVSSGVPIYDPALFDLLEERNVTIPVMIHGQTSRLYRVNCPEYGDLTQYGRKLTLFEEAARLYHFTWSGQANHWIEDILSLARDQKVDAMICFWPRGCIPILGAAKLLRERVERDLGIPVFEFEGGLIDPSGYDKARVHERLVEFIDMSILEKS